MERLRVNILFLLLAQGWAWQNPGVAVRVNSEEGNGFHNNVSVALYGIFKQFFSCAIRPQLGYKHVCALAFTTDKYRSIGIISDGRPPKKFMVICSLDFNDPVWVANKCGDDELYGIVLDSDDNDMKNRMHKRKRRPPRIRIAVGPLIGNNSCYRWCYFSGECFETPFYGASEHDRSDGAHMFASDSPSVEASFGLHGHSIHSEVNIVNMLKFANDRSALIDIQFAVSADNNPRIGPKHDKGSSQSALRTQNNNADKSCATQAPLRYIRKTGDWEVNYLDGKGSPFEDAQYSDYDVSCNGKQWFHLMGESCYRKCPLLMTHQPREEN